MGEGEGFREEVRLQSAGMSGQSEEEDSSGPPRHMTMGYAKGNDSGGSGFPQA